MPTQQDLSINRGVPHSFEADLLRPRPETDNTLSSRKELALNCLGSDRARAIVSFYSSTGGVQHYGSGGPPIHGTQRVTQVFKLSQHFKCNELARSGAP